MIGSSAAASMSMKESGSKRLEFPAAMILSEGKSTLWLAVPVVLAELGWMAMGVVDTVMVGRLGPEAIGAVGLGSSLHLALIVFGYGLMLGLDSMVSRAFGRGDLEDCRRSLVQGLYLSLAITPLLMGLVELAVMILPRTGITPEVRTLLGPYLRALNWSTPFLMIHGTLRRYMLALGRARAVMIALIAANLINVIGNQALIFGSWGAPELGVTGSGWATMLARVGMAATLVASVAMLERSSGRGLRGLAVGPDWARLRELGALGLPAAVHVLLEAGVFAAASALAGLFDAVSLAAHQVVLESASVTFMVPYGVSSVAAVRVGHAVGRGEPDRAIAAGWAALIVGEGFMATAGLAFLLIPRTILGFYTRDSATIDAGVTLFAIAACFQIFDGLQVISGGILRGSGDTHSAMYVNLLAYWVLGLPIGVVLAFAMGRGVPGLWMGLSAGLMIAGPLLLRTWLRRAARLKSGGERSG
ncbi:MAG: MATE family efflux transporter [Isosphaeraceae bacterium]|nr:MATE family efflux transporter [Isosphaeraceae bacterium]